MKTDTKEGTTMALVHGAWVIVYRMSVPNQTHEFLSSIGGWCHDRKDAEEAFKEALNRQHGFGRPHRIAYVQVTEIEPPPPG